MSDLFDTRLRAMRRDRAARQGVEPFLFDRVFDDCLERIAMSDRRFASALLIGCPIAGWSDRLSAMAEKVRVKDPGALFAAGAGGTQLIEGQLSKAAFDLVLSIGTLDTANDLPRFLSAIRAAMVGGGLFIAAFAGADTLPQLRAAMLAGDQCGGGAQAHVHPRIEAAAVAPLLEVAGFASPVVDVERTAVAYPSLARLVDDLRRMGATNILTSRSGPLSRAASETAASAFAAAGDGTRTIETIEIVHVAAWTPIGPSAGQQ